MANSRKKIRVAAFDFDGCVFNWDYIYKNYNPLQPNKRYEYNTDPERLLKSNNGLLNFVVYDIVSNKADEAFCISASNRQSKRCDDVNNMAGKGSSFPALLELNNAIDRRLLTESVTTHCNPDRYLLADSYGKQDPGTAFNACLANDPDQQHAEWFFDDSKLTLAYAQMHRFASNNPDAEIAYDFYDDKDDILNGLSEFFTQHPEFIPANVTLRLQRYAGSAIATKATIQGTGYIDNNYHANLFNLLDHAKISYGKDSEGRFEYTVMDDSKVNRGNVIAELSQENRAEAFITERNNTDPDIVRMRLLEKINNYYPAPLPGDPEITDEDALLKQAFRERLINLTKEIVKDIQSQKDAGATPAMIQRSSAVVAAQETMTLINNISDINSTKEEKIQQIQAFEINCKKHTRWSTFWKSLAVIAMIAVGVVIGGAIGMGIGIAAGAWSGPGAAITGIAGLFTGAVTGAAIGLTVGAAVTGMVSGAITAGLLFRDTPLLEQVQLTADKALEVCGEKSRLTM